MSTERNNWSVRDLILLERAKKRLSIEDICKRVFPNAKLRKIRSFLVIETEGVGSFRSPVVIAHTPNNVWKSFNLSFESAVAVLIEHPQIDDELIAEIYRGRRNE